MIQSQGFHESQSHLPSLKAAVGRIVYPAQAVSGCGTFPTEAAPSIGEEVTPADLEERTSAQAVRWEARRRVRRSQMPLFAWMRQSQIIVLGASGPTGTLHEAVGRARRCRRGPVQGDDEPQNRTAGSAATGRAAAPSWGSCHTIRDQPYCAPAVSPPSRLRLSKRSNRLERSAEADLAGRSPCCRSGPRRSAADSWIPNRALRYGMSTASTDGPSSLTCGSQLPVAEVGTARRSPHVPLPGLSMARSALARIRNKAHVSSSHCRERLDRASVPVRAAERQAHSKGVKISEKPSRSHRPDLRKYGASI